MKLAIMQPYFFPYIGYFQLIHTVDTFVVYDNIEYTKKGWINRNRFLKNGKDDYFTIPLKKDSDFLKVNQRFLSDNWSNEKIKMKNQIKNAYIKAPNFDEIYILFCECLDYDDLNLFNFIFNSIKRLCDYLDIKTKLILSSTIKINNELKAEERVKAICIQTKAKDYYNPIGGFELYKKSDFKNSNIGLFFLKSNLIEYPQFKNEFIPFLSILDVLMFNSKEEIKKIIGSEYTII